MDQVVHKAVYLQETSPNFATFCVTHVQDPHYQFLFNEQRTGERRLYLHLMETSRKKRKHESERESKTAVHLYSTESTVGLFTVHDVSAVWEDLRRGCHSGDVHGPHVPLPFTRKSKLQDFMHDLLHFAEHSSESARDRLVAFMMQHLPMTESFHRVVHYVFRELLFLLHATRSEEVHRVVRLAGEPALRHLLELFTTHLYAHKQRSHHKGTLYYGECFAYFGSQMLMLCVQELRQFGVDVLTLSFFTMCYDVTLTWSLDFMQGTAERMEEIGRSFETLMHKYSAESPRLSSTQQQP